MKRIVYNNRGVKVEIQGKLSVIVDGRTIENFEVSQIEDAIQLADEIADSAQIAA